MNPEDHWVVILEIKRLLDEFEWDVPCLGGVAHGMFLPDKGSIVRLRSSWDSPTISGTHYDEYEKEEIVIFGETIEVYTCKKRLVGITPQSMEYMTSGNRNQAFMQLCVGILSNEIKYEIN